MSEAIRHISDVHDAAVGVTHFATELEVADERFAAEPPQETTFTIHNQQTG